MASRAETDDVYLEITTWAGISFGAMHYYGHLKGYVQTNQYESVELERVLTADQAAKMNSDRRKMMPGERDPFLYRTGYSTGCFDTEDEVRDAAKKSWRKHFPLAKRLVEGSFTSGRAKTILAKRIPRDR